MHFPSMPRAGYGLLTLIFVAGCRMAGPERNAPLAEVEKPTVDATAPSTAAPTPSSTPTPLATSTPTVTPSPTPTPTPTAAPILVAGNPRAGRLQPPQPDGSAPCGLVDILDFPLEPPDGDGVVRGGQDFGIFRDRYGKYHTGEDWWFTGGGSSFGRPVYSIGHGLVTFADPLGWGRDKGTVVVQHTIAGGEVIYSFYGHLDPPSVILEAGDCVTRGQKIGEIGRPRTPPHLHFEIRTHLPYQGGPGYWPEDPTLAGWLWPSGTIWNNRIAGSPGVVWSRPALADEPRALGPIHGEAFIAFEGESLIGIDLTGGAPLWQIEFPDGASTAQLDAGQSLLYIAHRGGRVQAIRLPGGGAAGAAPEPIWEQDLDVIGTPILAPLPGGGVIFSVRDRLFALSGEGRLLWQQESAIRPLDWILSEDELIFSNAGREHAVWSANASGASPWNEMPNGRLVTGGEDLFLYGQDGLYRLDPESRSASLLAALPRAIVGQGDAISLPGGGVLIAHAGLSDRRIIALDAAGDLLWERSYARQVEREVNLFALGESVYLSGYDRSGAVGSLSIYAVDLDEPRLIRLFTGGSRSANYHAGGVFPAGGSLVVVNVAGRNLAAIDLKAAEEIVRGP